MSIRLGELLIMQGVITSNQRDEALAIQQGSRKPFGVIIEERFGVSPGLVEQAWAAQYAMVAQRSDPCALEIDHELLSLISKRQAWQFGLLPIEDLGDEIRFVAARETLARALRFAGWRVPCLSTFAICDLHTLKLGLEMHYPFAGANIETVDRFINNRPAA